ncbi:Hypothetical protein CINCED_3A009772, partial [Cinara cedri]
TILNYNDKEPKTEKTFSKTVSRERRQVRGGLWHASAPEIVKTIDSMFASSTTKIPIQIIQNNNDHNIFSTTTETTHKYIFPKMVPRGKRSVSANKVILVTEFFTDFDYEVT